MLIEGVTCFAHLPQLSQQLALQRLLFSAQGYALQPMTSSDQPATLYRLSLSCFKNY